MDVSGAFFVHTLMLSNGTQSSLRIRFDLLQVHTLPFQLSLRPCVEVILKNP